MHLIAIPWVEAWNSGPPAPLPKLQLIQWSHNDNASAFCVKASGRGDLAQEHMPWCGGNPEVCELSASDMQNQESRAKLPSKCSLWDVHCRCNWVSQVTSFISASLGRVAYLLGGICYASSVIAMWHCWSLFLLLVLHQFKKKNTTAEISKAHHSIWLRQPALSLYHYNLWL